MSLTRGIPTAAAQPRLGKVKLTNTASVRASRYRRLAAAAIEKRFSWAAHESVSARCRLIRGDHTEHLNRFRLKSKHERAAEAEERKY